MALLRRCKVTIIVMEIVIMNDILHVTINVHVRKNKHCKYHANIGIYGTGKVCKYHMNCHNELCVT